jgi:DNA invertase Pin-like site-specific DNA recombinase
MGLCLLSIAEAPMRVVGYMRVSTSGQRDEGGGLAAQRAAIEREAGHRGWEVVAMHEDTASGKSMKRRPGLDSALAVIEAGDADCLIVAKLDRLSRSLLDFCGLAERSRRRGWSIVALDLQVDTSTPAGEMMVNVLVTFAQFERRVIGQRTKDGIEAKRKHTEKVGYGTDGALKGPIGRKRQVDAETIRRIRLDRDTGHSFGAIAERLNAAGIRGGQGGQWWPATVRKVLLSARPLP